MEFQVFSSLILILIITIQTSNSVWGSIPFVGRCIKHSVVQNFNATKYQGIWYEIEKYFTYNDWGLSCITYRYDKPISKSDMKTGEGFSIPFIRKGIWKSRRYGRISTTIGNLEVPNPKKISGRLESVYHHNSIRNIRNSTKKMREAYWILATDYETYSVVWSCEGAGIMILQNVVFLARERDPSMFTRAYAYGAMQRRGLSPRLLIATDQENCPEDKEMFPIRKPIKKKKSRSKY